MAVNLDGAFMTISTFVPGMVERRHGRVVTLSACLGRFSGPGTSGGLAPYRVSKAGLNALTRNLVAELGHGRRGVLVDATCPGHCRTDLGGPDAPRTAEQGAATAVWLASRDTSPTTSAPPAPACFGRTGRSSPGDLTRHPTAALAPAARGRDKDLR